MTLAAFEGRWKLDRSENFDEFLQEMGVNFAVRKIAAAGSPTLTITISGEKMRIVTEMPIMNKEVTILLDGTEFGDVTNGVKAKCKASVSEGKVIVSNIFEGGKYKPQIHTREVVNGELIVTLDCDNGRVVCKRIFKKL